MSPTSEDDPWVRREPGFHDLRIELMRMYRRARRRPILTILVALVCAAGVSATRSRKKPSIAASVTFRISEVQSGDDDLATPPPTKELKEYVQSVAMRSANLIELMKARGMYPQLLESDPVTAVTFFRSDIHVNVYRNYFVEDWMTNRSARLVITYFAGTAEQATSIANDLGDLVVDEETRRREASASAAATDSRELVDFARADVDRRQEQIARLQVAIPNARPQQAQVMKLELEGLRKSLEPATDRLEKAEKTQADQELALVLEINKLGVRFDKVDDDFEVVTSPSTPMSLVMLGVMVFVLSLPLAAMFVGAFDSRVYDLDDVNRLGLHGLGHVPPFRGDQVGSLAARARASGRV